MDAPWSLDLTHAALLLAVGLSSGFLSGIVGMGGALLLVPVLAFILGMPFKFATGVASVHGLAVGIFGYLVHGRYGTVDVRLGLMAGAGSVVGGLIGAAISGLIDAFAVKIIYLGAAGLSLVLLLSRKEAPGSSRERTPAVPHAGAISALLGALTGVVSGNIGAGGTFMLVPLSRWALKMPIHRAIGTGMLVSIFSAVAAASGKALLGQIPWHDTAIVVSGSAAGTIVGARLTRRIPSRPLRGVMIVIMLLLLARTLADLFIG